LTGEIKSDAQNRGAIFHRRIAGTAEQGLIYVFEPLNVIAPRLTSDRQQNGEIEPFRRQHAWFRSPGLCSCSPRRRRIAQIKQSRQGGTQFGSRGLAPLNQFVCGNSTSDKRNRDSAERSAASYNPPTFKFESPFYLFPKIKKLPITWRAMSDVFPGGIARGARSIGQFSQYICAGAAFPFGVREFTEDGLLNNILESFENFIGGVVRHRSQTLWHPIGFQNRVKASLSHSRLV
jgi:hypothetical protein